MELKVGEYDVTLLNNGAKFRTVVKGTVLDAPSLAGLKRKVDKHLENLRSESQFKPVKLIDWSGTVTSGSYGRIEHVHSPRVVEIVGFEVRKKKGRGGGFEQVYKIKRADKAVEETTYVNGTYHPYSDELLADLDARTKEINDVLRERYEKTRETMIKMALPVYVEKVQEGE